MINKLRLENFKGIREGETEFSPLTILLGGNNSGKSTILETLFLMPNPVRDVPYWTPGYRGNAVEIIQSLHETLDSKGFAFLLYNYTAGKAEIECDIDGELYSLYFIKEGSLIHLCTDKVITGAIFRTAKGEEMGGNCYYVCR